MDKRMNEGINKWVITALFPAKLTGPQDSFDYKTPGVKFQDPCYLPT